MADPLTPISGNQQRSRTYTGTSVKSSTSFATATEENQHTHTADETVFSSDIVAPSSPFLYEAERSSRSPTKHHSPSKNRTKSRSPQKVALNDSRPRYPLTEETLRINENSLETPRTAQIKGQTPNNRNYSPSESCLSAFSAIPNVDMTMFAKLGLTPSKSPGKRGSQDEPPSSPSRSRPNTPGTVRPNRTHDLAQMSSPDLEDSTVPLMDFTEQLNMVAQSNRSPVRTRSSPLKDSRDMQYKHQHRIGSPTRDPAGFKPVTPGQAREFTNLLDFDLPPAPTPRSIPAITARELESVKATFLSQISALKATISGKEAEINALSAAASDAETRVGDALEQLRDTRNIKEALEQEKEDWDKRDQQTQEVLRDVRAQIQDMEEERKQLEREQVAMDYRLNEAERRAEDAETRAAENKVASDAAGAGIVADGSPEGTTKAVQVAVEKVARELHTLYKAKHETKVAQLKKSYEARWSKKTAALQSEVDRLDKELQESKMEVDGLRHELEEAKSGGRAEAMTTIKPDSLAELETKDRDITELKQEIEQVRTHLEKVCAEKDEIEQRADHLATGHAGDSARTKDLESKVESLTSEVGGLRSSSKALKKELEMCREENSQLVATVDEFLAMDIDAPITSVAAIQTETRPTSSHSRENSRPGSSLSTRQETAAAKPSGLKGPGTFGFSQSRIGMGPPGMKRVASGSRSGIMSNIEKMGMGRSRGVEH